MNLRVFPSSEELRRGLEESIDQVLRRSLVPSIALTGGLPLEVCEGLGPAKTNVSWTILRGAADGIENELSSRRLVGEVSCKSLGSSLRGSLPVEPFDLVVADRSVFDHVESFSEVVSHTRQFVVVLSGPALEMDAKRVETIAAWETLDGGVWWLVDRAASEALGG